MKTKVLFFSIVFFCLIPFVAFSQDKSNTVGHTSVSCTYKPLKFEYSCEYSQTWSISFDNPYSQASGLQHSPLNIDNKVKGEITLSKDGNIVLGELLLNNKKINKLVVNYDLTFKNEHGFSVNRKGTVHMKRLGEQKIDLGNLMKTDDLTKDLYFELKISIASE